MMPPPCAYRRCGRGVANSIGSQVDQAHKRDYLARPYQGRQSCMRLMVYWQRPQLTPSFQRARTEQGRVEVGQGFPSFNAG